jgi:hypothetical protein
LFEFPHCRGSLFRHYRTKRQQRFAQFLFAGLVDLRIGAAPLEDASRRLVAEQLDDALIGAVAVLESVPYLGPSFLALRQASGGVLARFPARIETQLSCGQCRERGEPLGIGFLCQRPVDPAKRIGVEVRHQQRVERRRIQAPALQALDRFRKELPSGPPERLARRLVVGNIESDRAALRGEKAAQCPVSRLPRLPEECAGHRKPDEQRQIRRAILGAAQNFAAISGQINDRRFILRPSDPRHLTCRRSAQPQRRPGARHRLVWAEAQQIGQAGPQCRQDWRKFLPPIAPQDDLERCLCAADIPAAVAQRFGKRVKRRRHGGTRKIAGSLPFDSRFPRCEKRLRVGVRCGT